MAAITVSGFTRAVNKACDEQTSRKGRNEYPSGSNKTAFGKAFGWDGVPYCAQAVGVTDCVWGYSDWYASMTKSASSSAIMSWHRRAGRSVPLKGRLQRGDLIHLFKNGRSVHIERVLSHRNGVLICVGSNTSNAGGGSTADGGGTYINDRSAWWRNRGSNSGYSIKGVSRPLYGLTTEAVKLVQKTAGITVDGKYGPATRKATILVQRKYGLTEDGFPGPATLAAIQGGKVIKDVVAVPAKDKANDKKYIVPNFPLPRKEGALYYYGDASGPITSVSGKGKNSAVPHDVVFYKGGWHSKGLRLWQKAAKIEADGRFGPQTEAKVRELQKRHGKKVDGRIGPDTWKLAFIR